MPKRHVHDAYDFAVWISITESIDEDDDDEDEEEEEREREEEKCFFSFFSFFGLCMST